MPRKDKASAGNRQPHWLPDNVWADYCRMSAYASFKKSVGDNGVSTQVVDIFRRIALDEDCKCIWDVVYSRVNDEGLGVRNPLRVAPHSTLTMAAMRALTGPAAGDLIPASERKERGKDIASLATKLHDELRALARCGGIPAEIADPIGDELFHAIATHTPVVHPQPLGQMDQLDKMRADLIARDIFFLDHSSNFFIALKTGAEAWAQTKPIEYRPDGELVKRNYFVRHMTGYFCEHFGQPYRKQVAALTKCLVNVDLSVQEITRIAPVKAKSGPDRKSGKRTISRNARNRRKI